LEQPLQRGVCLLAVRALQVAEFDDRHWRIRRTAGGAGRFLLQLQTRLFERMAPEGNDLSDHCVLAILGDEERLCALSLRTTDLNAHLRQAFGLAWPDAGDFPRELRIIAERGLQKPVHFIFGGKALLGVVAHLASLRLGRGLLLRHEVKTDYTKRD